MKRILYVKSGKYSDNNYLTTEIKTLTKILKTRKIPI